MREIRGQVEHGNIVSESWNGWRNVALKGCLESLERIAFGRN